jgi:hypothetical protein
MARLPMKKEPTEKRELPASVLIDAPLQTCPRSAGYEIRVRDHLETYWFEWFEGWSITNLENGEVLLKGHNIDQSKLHGALNKVRDLNLTLLAVTCVPENSRRELEEMMPKR